MKNLFEPLGRWVLEEPGYGRSPQACVDSRGRLWVAWISWFEGVELVRAEVRDSTGEWSKSFSCSEPESGICSLAIAPWGDGILIAWVDEGDEEKAGLKLRHIELDRPAHRQRLVLPKRRLPSGVALASDTRRFLLAWTVREPGGRRLEAILGDDSDNLPSPMILSEGHGLDICPSAAFSSGNPWIAWQHMGRSSSRIRIGMVEDGGLVVGPSDVGGAMFGIEAASCLVGDGEGGVWAGWQSDVDEERGPGLVRWIKTSHIDAQGLIRVPATPMTGVNRAGKGEDQGFESPSLVMAPSGRIVIIGLASQSLRRQDLYGNNWSEIGKIESEGWQCRGRRFSACATGEGVAVIGREREGIVVRMLPFGSSDQIDETPQLVDAQGHKGDDMRDSIVPRTLFTQVAGRQVLFGDIHQHTMASDGTGTAEETFQRARTRYGDDIVAIADHESFIGKRTPPGEWAQFGSVADDFYEPGSFVTLKAFEWTGSMHPGPGHKVVYTPAEGGPLLSRDDEATKTSSGLIEACRRNGSIAIPHHVGWTGADMENHDPAVQSCFEMVSCHGAYERRGEGQIIGTRGDDKEGQFIIDALDKGLRFGFTGGSDGHGLNWHHGVCRMEDSHRSGLTAVFTEEATRQGVLDAIAARRCYATSGAKIKLWFDVEGAVMGEEIQAGGAIPFTVIVGATAPIKALTLVTNGGRESRLDAAGSRVEIQGVLPPPENGGWAYYFVRVEQEDGHVAWSSPIWLDSAVDPLDGRLTA